jgi:hypothetical protein
MLPFVRLARRHPPALRAIFMSASNEVTCMSKQTLRRAAEREAHKANRHSQLAADSATTYSPVTYSNGAQPVSTQSDSAQSSAGAPSLSSNPNASASDSETSPTTSAAQIFANRANAMGSTGPVTPEGKAAVSQNRRIHGLAGRFTVLAWENAADFEALAQSVHAEYNPNTDTEQRLANSLIQHHWLKERALQLQEQLIAQSEDPTNVDSKKLSLLLRYQTTHERSYYKAERELQNLNKAKRKEQIGFESQNRQQEAHDARTRLTHARAQNLEIDTACRQTMEAPLPGNTRLSFEVLAKACSVGIATAVYQNQFKATA